MAALLKHGFHIRSPFILPSVTVSFMRHDRSDVPASHDLPTPVKLEDNALSLSAKGFLRSQKPYNPPSDVKQQLLSIGRLFLGANVDKKTKIESPEDRFKILAECFRVFGHGVPNSLLHLIETMGDLVEFYQTPVDTTTPLERMKTMKLPPNLHVQYDYHRFHPDTDVMFGGVSAFPKSSTIVSGLKYKKKYKGYSAKTSWP